MIIKQKRTAESPQAIAMRLSAQLGAQQALEVCDGIAGTRYPLGMREAYRAAARIIAGSHK